MPSCVIQGCTSGSKRDDPSVILHVFPNNFEKVKEWLIHTGHDPDTVDVFAQEIIAKKKDDTYRMCSKHFLQSCYTVKNGRKRLKADALPVLTPEFLQQRLARRKRIKILTGQLHSDKTPSTSAGSFTGPFQHSEQYAVQRVSVGTNSEYFPGQRHKTTMTKCVSKDKGVLVKPHSKNVYVQCNLIGEPLQKLCGDHSSQSSDTALNASQQSILKKIEYQDERDKILLSKLEVSNTQASDNQELYCQPLDLSLEGNSHRPDVFTVEDSSISVGSEVEYALEIQSTEGSEYATSNIDSESHSSDDSPNEKEMPGDVTYTYYFV